MGGLGQPVALGRDGPDGTAAGRRPGRHRRPRSATSSGTLGPIFTLYVAGILSANLALVNILPFPPLDGGRMLMITLKRFFGARISLRAEQMTYLVGFVFLFAFLIWVTGFDIVRQPRRRRHHELPGQLRPRRRRRRSASMSVACWSAAPIRSSSSR